MLNVAGGQGLSGWTVKLVDASGAEKLLRTNESGFYRFSELTAGAAMVTIELPGEWRSVSPLPTGAAAAPGAACAVVDFWTEQARSETPPTQDPFER